VRAFERWRVGRRGIDDGAVLFVFTDDHRARIEVGYGLGTACPTHAPRASSTSAWSSHARQRSRRAVRGAMDALMGAIGGPGGAGAPEAQPPHIPIWALGLIGIVGCWCWAVLSRTRRSRRLLFEIGRGGGDAAAAARRRRIRRRRVLRRGRELRRRRRLRIMVMSSAPRQVHGIDVARVEDAVRAAERRTSGEIRVAVARFYFWGDVHVAAAHAFERLRVAHTRRRNGVLIFVAPRRRRFAVIGDVGIHQQVSPDFWRQVVDAVGAELRRGDLTAGIIRGVGVVADELATRFPPDPGGGINELPDAVAVPGRETRRD
jgi:uncharacterized membrane protein YgcG